MPQKAHGRQLFFTDLLAAVAARRPGGVLTQTGKVMVMRTHGEKWGRLTSERRAAYDRKATAAAEQKQEDKVQDWLHLQARVALVRQRISEERVVTSAQMRLANCRLSEADLEELATM